MPRELVTMSPERSRTFPGYVGIPGVLATVLLALTVSACFSTEPGNCGAFSHFVVAAPRDTLSPVLFNESSRAGLFSSFTRFCPDGPVSLSLVTWAGGSVVTWLVPLSPTHTEVTVSVGAWSLDTNWRARAIEQSILTYASEAQAAVSPAPTKTPGG
jgi:hypothetical protein